MNQKINLEMNEQISISYHTEAVQVLAILFPSVLLALLDSYLTWHNCDAKTTMNSIAN